MTYKFEKILPWISLGVILLVTPLLFMKWPRQRKGKTAFATNQPYLIFNYTDYEWLPITNWYDHGTNFISWRLIGPTNRTPK